MKGNVLLVGASGDIGAAIARQLEAAGFGLLLHYNQNAKRMDELREKLRPESILLELKADLRDEENVHALLEQLVFPVHHVVFASGAADYGLFQDVTYEKMDEMLNLHVKSPWVITKNLLPSMLSNQSGNIVFITSIWGAVGASNEVIYSSVKGAQNSFVKALAREVGPSGVRVNAVSPGYIRTKMNAQLSEDDSNLLEAEIPLGRAGNPLDVANAVAFLLNEKSSYIHGEIMNVDGGWS
ncbi:SDR family oxidoreductase [Aciduricibacillus chroicocephali]|uniref:SDR family oxidoreductase n=1 Tax=Aciduricibacillus chroicocephali TaxID=3054939 RepID=A0ABY9KYV1_9BACI|nr:SDR family oxidoreductase [Bacillaceae bacterium 44XB]